MIAYNLQFFAKEGPGGEKTEEPTSKKLSDARKEGQVAKSKEIANATGLIAMFLILNFPCVRKDSGDDQVKRRVCACKRVLFIDRRNNVKDPYHPSANAVNRVFDRVFIRLFSGKMESYGKAFTAEVQQDQPCQRI